MTPTGAPSGRVLVEGFCIDRYEAPNRAGALPLVMYHFEEAAAWCLARDKRLCFDDEWTRRRDGGTTDVHGNLKGRYWAESRTCQSGVTSHGDYFRFYEIGFRCCRDPLQP